MSQKQGAYSQNRAPPGVRMNAYQRAPVQKKVEDETKAPVETYVSAFSRAPVQKKVEPPLPSQMTTQQFADEQARMTKQFYDDKAPLPSQITTQQFADDRARRAKQFYDEKALSKAVETKTPVETYVSAFSRAPKKQVETKPIQESSYGKSPALQAHIANLRESASVAYKAKEEPKEEKALAVAVARAKKCAFAIIHFGKNPVYLEYELYFLKMLRQYTNNDIIYLYSVNDTPDSFVDAVRPLVTSVVPYDDNGITFNVTFSSGYTNFNTLRTCNFIFAYTLEQYDTVCIVESDMVIMKPIDSIFDFKTPAALTYHIGDERLKFNMQLSTNPSEVLAICKERNGIGINGGVMLINPSKALFETYKSKIPDIVSHECKYPNETLFEYVNNKYYNLPVQYNLSHFLAKPYKLQNYGLRANDIVVYHFNETKYKHLDIIKNPMDENGDNWLDIIQKDKKYDIKKLPILHYKNTVYDKYREEIEPLLANLAKPSKKERTPVSSKKDEIRPISPLPIKSKSSTKSKSKSSSNSSNSSKTKKPKCPKGTRRSKKTGNCEPYTKQARCPKGTRRNKKTGNCEPK